MGLCLFWDIFSFSQSHAVHIYCYLWHANVLSGIASKHRPVFNMCPICRQGLEEQRNFWNIKKLLVEKCRKRTSPSHLGFVSFTWWMWFRPAQRKWHDLSPWINTDSSSPIGGIWANSFRQDVNTMRAREYWSRYYLEDFCLHAQSLQCRMASTERLYEVWMLYCNKVNSLQWMHLHRVNAFNFSRTLHQ